MAFPERDLHTTAPLRFSPGLIILAFFVSYVGAFTTIELLCRRGNCRGWLKWIQMLSCSIAFAIVCVWCMAFVVNSAMLLGDGDPELQLFYDPAFVILSAVVPLVVSFLAFLVSDFRYRGSKSHSFSLATSGPTSGLAVVAMHYVASFGASNYRLSYRPGYIAGAILIACAACTVVVVLVFKLQDKWLATLKWRMLCALLLSAAVTGMHLEALAGTEYSLEFPDHRAPKQRIGTLVVAVALGAMTVFTDLLLFAHSCRRHKRLSDRAQQVVLACARFDHEGKIMVTREGMLPCRKLTTQDNHRAFDDEFNNSHEAFLWIFRASNDWPSVTRWLPAMRRHLRAVEEAGDADSGNPNSDAASVWSLRREDEDYSVIFRESFCAAAARLAEDLKEPLHELGRLFDAVMTSGSRDNLRLPERPRLAWNVFRARGDAAEVRVGSATMDIWGRGQVLFLVKRTDRKDIPKYQSMGYRFMPVAKVTPLFAEIMQVPEVYLNEHLVKARVSALDMDSYKKQPAGVFLACFAVKPGIVKRSWEVLVNKEQLHKLPCVPLWSQHKMTERKRFVDALDGQTVTICLAYLEERSMSLDREEEAFARAFRRAILALAELVAEPFFRQATLSSKLTKAPVNDHTGRVTHCTLLSVHVLPDIHGCALQHPERLTYIPLSLFKCRQQTLERMPADPVFRGAIQQEFTKLFEGRNVKPAGTEEDGVALQTSPDASRRASNWRASSKWGAPGGISLRSLTSSIVSTSGAGVYDRTSADVEHGSYAVSVRSLPYSATIAESDTATSAMPLDSSETGDEKRTSSRLALLSSESSRLGGAMEQTPKQTFVDELFAVATAKWAR